MCSHRGKFIAFEGIDGSGKTTMMALVENRLRREGIPYTTTREPGGTRIGEAIRTLLLGSARGEMTPATELLLYAADRAQHVEEVIRPALNEGRIVLSDRYAEATLAYQGYGRGFDLELVRQLIELATRGLRTDVTVVLDLDVEEAQARLRARNQPHAKMVLDRLDDETIEFHRRVREGYLEIARREPERVKVIDASGSVERTGRLVLEAVEPTIESWKAGRLHSCRSQR